MHYTEDAAYIRNCIRLGIQASALDYGEYLLAAEADTDEPHEDPYGEDEAHDMVAIDTECTASGIHAGAPNLRPRRV